MTDFRALCAELLEALENAIRVIYHEDGTKHISTADPVIAKADAALAQPESQGQVLARVKFAEREFNCPSDIVLRQYCDDWFYSDPERSEVDPVDLCRDAIKLFAQIPAPVPVSERLPEPEDCDAEGRCWWGIPQTSITQMHWIYRKKKRWDDGATTHWLPHWALPVPRAEAHNG
jgi:hypothetical protein